MNINTFISKLINTFVTTLSVKIENQSIRFNNGDSINYPYAYGYMKSEVETLLNRLNLTKKQLEILEDYIKGN